MKFLGLAPAAIERVRADIAVVPLFSERPLRDAAGRVDWRLCGHLSHLLAEGRPLAEPGQAVLIPGGGGMRARGVLGLGVGERAELDASRWERWVDEALDRAHRLAAQHLLLALPDSAGEPAARIAALAERAAAEPGPEEISLAPEPGDAPAASEWLRARARRRASGGLEFRSPDEARVPQGGSPARSPVESSRASADRSTR